MARPYRRRCNKGYNARRYLQQFCSLRRDGHQAPPAVGITGRSATQPRSWRVGLPFSINSVPRCTNSLSKRRKEKMAKSDTAFEACKRFFHTELVNEIASRAQAACNGSLNQIKPQGLCGMISALTALAADQHNYQRLQYVGDTLLKFYTSVNLFCNNSQMPESHLSDSRRCIIGSGRLQRASRGLGIDAFLKDAAVTGPQWTPLVKDGDLSSQTLLSKTSAGVVEALLGAAYADAKYLEKESRVLSALSSFLPEVAWKPPLADILVLKTSLVSSPHMVHRLCEIEDMIGYHFENSALLAEALTHSTLQAGFPSYERLEFLGDACLDRIVNMELYQSSVDFDERAMVQRQSCLVNEHILGFFNTRMTHQLEHYSTQTDLETRKKSFHIESREVYLNDYVLRVIDINVSSQRAKFLEYYKQVEGRISSALENGPEFPWSDLFHLDAPKPYGDIIESILGACFIDSNGSLEACRKILIKIGLMKVLRRLASDPGVVCAQPLVRVRELNPEIEVKVKRIGTKRAGTFHWACRLSLDGNIVGQSTQSVGATCRAEAISRAAEDALTAGLLTMKRKRKMGAGLELGHEAE